MELLVIGYDGLPFWLTEKLPALGVVRPLDAEVVGGITMSGPSWTTIYTGLSVAEHRVTAPMGQEGPGAKGYADLKGKVIWDILGKDGHTVALGNLPCTRAVRKVNGFHVAGFPRTPTKYRYPYSLPVPDDFHHKTDLGMYADYEDGGWGDWGGAIRGLGVPEVAFSLVKEHSVEIAEWFVELAYGADFGWITFTFLDRLGHLLGMTPQAQEASLASIRATLSVLRDLEPESTLIISDHGFKPGHEKSHLAHEPEGVVAAQGLIANLVKTQERWKTRDVVALIAACFDSVAPEASEPPTEEELEDAGREVQDRLEAHGYLEEGSAPLGGPPQNEEQSE